MFVIFGWNHQEVTSIGPVYQHQCPNCHNTEFWHLSKISKYFTLFFIPVFPYGSDNWYYCPTCNYSLKLEREDFIFYKQIAEINCAFIDQKISEEERGKKLEIINSSIEVHNESKRLKYLEESKNWREKVSEKSDEELIDILRNKRGDYNPAFIIAAEEESKKRNLDIK